MSLTCPACNKPAQTGDTCQRCGCELAQLHRVHRAAQDCLQVAVELLQQQDWAGALTQTEHSWTLHHSPAAARCAFVLCAILGDTATALQWLSRGFGAAGVPPRHRRLNFCRVRERFIRERLIGATSQEQ